MTQKRFVRFSVKVAILSTLSIGWSSSVVAQTDASAIDPAPADAAKTDSVTQSNASEPTPGVAEKPVDESAPGTDDTSSEVDGVPNGTDGATPPATEPGDSTTSDVVDAAPSETPSVVSPAEMVPVPQGPVPPPPTTTEPPPSVCPDRFLCLEKNGFAAWPRVRFRAGFEAVQPDPSIGYIGQNDGFFIQQARLGIGATYRNIVNFLLIVDGAALLPGRQINDPVHPLSTALVDAVVHYVPTQYFQLWVGQLYMPIDREATLSGDQYALNPVVFINRSVLAEGVHPGHGFEVAGLSPDRQIGVVVGANNAALGPVRLDYRIGLANGNGRNFFGNDNKLPAVYGRFGIGFENYAQIAVGGNYNIRTTGALPNLFDETQATAYTDFRAEILGFDFLAQAIVRQTSYDTLFPNFADAGRTQLAYGATSWLVLNDPFGVPFYGFKPGLRLSYYDPSTAFTDDQYFEQTLALRFDSPLDFFPVAVLTEFTSLVELDDDGIFPLDNNRVALLLHVDF